MARTVILVNGVPGSGKTTLAGALAEELGCPVLSKDRIKEALADAVSSAEVQPSLGRIAIETLWRLAANVAETVVVESWWYAPRDRGYVADGLSLAGAKASLEVWCEVPIEIARERYDQRHRHTVHHDDRDMADEWRQWSLGGVPIGLGPVLRVDTRAPVDAAEISHRVSAMLTTTLCPVTE